MSGVNFPGRGIPWTVPVLALGLVAGAGGAETQRRATGVVLTLEPGPGVTREQAGALSDRIGGVLDRSGACVVLPRERIPEAAERTARLPGMSALDHAGALGAALNADYVVFGTVRVVDAEYEVATTLAESVRKRVVRSFASRHAGAWDEVLRSASLAHVRGLLGVRQAPEPAPPSRPPEAPPEAAPEPPSEAPPAERDRGVRVRPETEPLRFGRDFSIGGRLVWLNLLEDSSESFIGSVDKLEADQGSIPLELFARWFFTGNWGVELAWDKLQARTKTSAAGYSDGDFALQGPILAGTWRHENATRLTPYFGAGLALLSGHFEAEDWWRLGYPDPVEWETAGTPETRSAAGITQSISVDSAVGWVLYGGCRIVLSEAWSLDAHLRRTGIEVDVTHKVFLDDLELFASTDRRSIPFDHVAFGFGVQYTF